MLPWEDDIIAYSWSKFLRTGDETWPLRLPMTKAVVRAMDTIADFCARRHSTVDRFIVGGASKRRWTTWTTAAVDKRVVGFVPVVADALNLVPNVELTYPTSSGKEFKVTTEVRVVPDILPFPPPPLVRMQSKR